MLSNRYTGIKAQNLRTSDEYKRKKRRKKE